MRSFVRLAAVTAIAALPLAALVGAPTASAAPASVQPQRAAVTAVAPQALVPVSAAPAARLAASGTTDVILHNPYPTKDRLAAGWTVKKQAKAAPEGPVCTMPAVSGWTRNTYTCFPAALYAVACYKKTGYTNVITCVTDARRKVLVEYRVKGSLPATGLAAPANRRAAATVLADGTYCRLASSGVAVRPKESVLSWAGCETTAMTRLWQNEDGSDQYRVNGSFIQYRAATEQAGSPMRWVNVATRYWLG